LHFITHGRDGFFNPRRQIFLSLLALPIRRFILGLGRG
jgi:hypothetical protein